MLRRSWRDKCQRLSCRSIFIITVILTGWVGFHSLNSYAIYPPNIRFERLLEDQDIVLGEVEAIYQDQDGFMWIGGRNGLYRYDGYEFRQLGINGFDQTDGDQGLLDINSVRDVIQDSQGRIWIASNGRIFCWYPRAEKLIQIKTEKFLNQDGTSVDFRRILEVDSDNLIVATSSGIGLISAHDQNLQLLEFDIAALEKNEYLNINSFARIGNKIWAGSNQGLFKLDFSERTLEPVYSSEMIGSSNILDMSVDPDNNLWIAGDNGLGKYNTLTRDYVLYTFDKEEELSQLKDNLWTVVVDKNGYVWFGSDGLGVGLFDPDTEKFLRYLTRPADSTSINSNVVRRIYEDNSGTIWVGNYPKGLSVFSPESAAISLFIHNPAIRNSLSHSSVSTVEILNNELWLGTDGGGLNRFDAKTGKFEHYYNDKADLNSISSNAIISSLSDSSGNIWLGTWGGGISIYDPRSRKFTRVPLAESSQKRGAYYESRSLDDPNIWGIYEDRAGHYWLSTHNGGVKRYDPEQGLFSNFTTDAARNDQLPSNLVWDVLEDSYSNLWVGTPAGLALLNKDSDGFKVYRHDKNDLNSLSHSSVLTIYEDSKRRLWFGTNAGLNLFNRKDNNFYRFGKFEGFENEVIKSILEDDDGTLWMGTDNGIVNMNPETYDVKNYMKLGGKNLGGFNYNAAGSDRNKLYFGGVEGLLVINTDKLQEGVNNNPVIFTNFKLFAKDVKIEPGGVLEASINHVERVVLGHDKTMFTFEFSALNYRGGSDTHYAYKLMGFDDEWRYLGKRRTATFTNIDPGEYILKVKAGDEKGVWSSESRDIYITQLAPPWKTIWAYIFYLVFILATVLFYLKLQKNKIQKEQETNRKLRQLDKLKDDFMASTSHELRTPLNGMIGLTESLIDGVGGKPTPLMQKNLKMIAQSGRRLSNLVNDILDYSKLRSNSIEINKKPLDLHALAEVVVTLSKPLIGKRNLVLQNAVPEQLETIYADEDRLQQILYNLIGNAIKFSDIGYVTITADRISDNKVMVCVSDTGIGIPADKLESIFESFEQIDGSVDRIYSGTGLGLAVTKKLVEIHGGKISVDSVVGQGSNFRFTLDVAQEAPRADERLVNRLQQTKPSQGSEDFLEEMVETDSTEPDDKNASVNILVVDDEPINRQVLVNHLSLQNYVVQEAGSGREALELLQEDLSFDLILLDIMMPRMSGFEVAELIRQKHDQSELPIIFLTANNQVADLVIGFDSGANDFITKPISKEELLARVKTHIQLLEINRTLEHKVELRTKELAEEHARLKEAQSKLVQSETLASVGTLVAGMAHEINNPANFTYGSAYSLELELRKFKTHLYELTGEGAEKEVLEDFDQSFDKFFGFLTAMRDGTQRIKSLVEDLRNFSRPSEIDFREQNLKQNLQICIDMMRANFEEINFKLSAPDDIVYFCEPTELNQVFINIIANACQAIEIKNSTATEEILGEVEVRLEKNAGKLAISIKDNGCGMSAFTQKHMFEPFFTTRSVGKGAGLGLSICYQIIQKHGGEISCESNEEIGSMITLSLPVESARRVS